MENILFENFKGDFRLGAALAGIIYDSEQRKIIKETSLLDEDIASRHFNLIVAENDTKMELVYKAEKTFDFTRADKLIQFGKKMDF